MKVRKWACTIILFSGLKSVTFNVSIDKERKAAVINVCTYLRGYIDEQ